MMEGMLCEPPRHHGEENSDNHVHTLLVPATTNLIDQWYFQGSCPGPFSVHRYWKI